MVRAGSAVDGHESRTFDHCGTVRDYRRSGDIEPQTHVAQIDLHQASSAGLY
jgi:hypothetical protein